MSVIKKISDLTAAAIGYFVAAPNDHVVTPVNTFLSANLSISQNVVDEVVKAFAALVIAVVSRWIYARFEAPKKKRPRTRTRRPYPPPSPMPESLTLNTNTDEKVSEQN